MKHTTLQQFLKQIDEKKAQLDQLRPLSHELVNNLDEWLSIQLTYSSNALEGNTLTSLETALVIQKGITIGGKSVREHLEAINHAHALDFITSLVTQQDKSISLSTLLDIHRLILKGIDDKHAGTLRSIMVAVAGSPFQFPDPIKVRDYMNDFVDWMATDTAHPVLHAALAHYKLVTIHPFVDGNGRTARLLMNLLLMRHGYPIVWIESEHRLQYLQALQKAQLYNDLDDFYQLCCHAVLRSLDFYLDAAKKSLS